MKEGKSSVYIDGFASVSSFMFCWIYISVDPAKTTVTHSDSASHMREPNFMDLHNIIFYSTGIHPTGGCLIGWEIEAKKCLSLTVFEASEVTDLIYNSAVLSWPSIWMNEFISEWFEECTAQRTTPRYAIRTTCVRETW